MVPDTWWYDINVKVYENPNSSECIRCGKCMQICPRSAIYFSYYS
ncbi:hypothetical protein DW187_09475 [Ruminococcus sp. AM16-34]|nr:4Fe-4S binding protein [Agathobacter sp.]MBS6171747.1 4Fe-4S binding protein [Clostridiales bacterium]RGF10810.1 hypothetical protein DW187_09475 [Ruminococcus sp. AM16-34]